MMFQGRFHAGIVDGSITTTFRYWKRPQAKAGGYQKIAPIGRIRIVDVRTVSTRGIRDAHARSAGFDSRKELIGFLETMADPSRELYRIDFEFVGKRKDLDPEQGAAGSADEIAEIDKALDLRDRNSRVGPWTRATLALVGENPGMSSKDLATILKRDRAELKQDMRKLKKLGLTESLEVGYRLTPRARSYLTKSTSS